MNKTPVSLGNLRAVGYPCQMTISLYFFLFVVLFPGVVANAQNLSPTQIKQIEDIALNIASQSNANKQAMLDEITVSFNAIAAGRNIRFENVLRVKKGLPPDKVKEWLDATRAEITPNACAQNANNPAFDRGLSYTFAYSNTYGEKLGDVFVDKATCKSLGF
jgi:hypothetical protein